MFCYYSLFYISSQHNRSWRIVLRNIKVECQSAAAGRQKTNPLKSVMSFSFG